VFKSNHDTFLRVSKILHQFRITQSSIIALYLTYVFSQIRNTGEYFATNANNTEAQKL